SRRSARSSPRRSGSRRPLKSVAMKSAVRHLGMLLLVCFTSACWAEDAYPSRPVKLVAPFPASGPLDLLARLVALKLGEQWKNPVVVENVTGATGSIGANAVARAA